VQIKKIGGNQRIPQEKFRDVNAEVGNKIVEKKGLHGPIGSP